MCGFAGFILQGSSHAMPLATMARQMSDAIVYRGPDDGGIWIDEQNGVALSHRRLSILDLSPEGHQPMISSSGRYVIAYNGEVYNFNELRRQLEKEDCLFRGHSDTEIILAAIENWGFLTAVKQFIGMFALALWDKQEKRIYLLRDRLGIKPLYYGWVNHAFVFGSELSALKAFPGFQQGLNRDAVALLMRHNYIPAPYSIYDGIHKLEPGCLLELALNSLREPDITPYWSAKAVAEAGALKPFKGSDIAAINRLDALIGDAVELRMVSDVPLGAFLSGGFDSTMVVAQMQARSNRPIKTFSIGFNEEGYNEAEHAKLIARHLQTDHTEWYVTSKDAMAVIPQLPTMFNEPFADSSQIPTFLVSKLAKEHVTVSLSGDGGDELFCGYERYFQGQQIWGKLGVLPKTLRTSIASGISSVPRPIWNRLFKYFGFILPKPYRFAYPGDKLHKLAEVLATDSGLIFYQQLLSHWKSPTDLILQSHEPLTVFTDKNRQARLSHFQEQMMFTDLISYLPDDILTKVDRSSMAVGLEARVPLIDHRLVEFAWQLPMQMKVRNGEGKWILRQVLDRYVPRSLMDRPKMGFGVPIDVWLRHDLRDWAGDLLDEHKLSDQGFFNVPLIRQKWREHLDGGRQWHYYLWNVLMFQAWLQENR